MKSGLGTRAFTIVETLIFLAVSAALLISAMTLLNGQQQKTEFSQAVNDVTSQVQTIVSNVSNGYYNSANNFSCAPGPTLSGGSNKEGTNGDCVFAGRVIQFAVQGSTGEGYNIYDLAGNRLKPGTDQPPTTFSELNPTPIAHTNGGADTTEQDQLKYGLSVTRMYYWKGGAKNNIGAVGFITSLPALAGGSTGGLQTSSSTVELHPIKTSQLNEPPDSLTDISKASGNIKASNFDITDDGVVICFKSGGTNQYGVMTIGGNGRQISVKMDILGNQEATSGGSAPCV